MATLLMGPAARFHYRADRPTPRLRPITLSDRSCSCWIVLRQSRNSTAARIARAIGFTRFPYSSPIDENEIDEEGSLLRAADLIGQLGDPHYLRKANALYYEFEEIGLNKQLGYEIADGPRRQISAILLEQHFSAHPGRYPLPECHLEWASLD